MQNFIQSFQATEDIIEPELSIIDAHHHLWPATPPHFPSPYLFDDIRRDVGSGHNIKATIYIDAYANYYDTGPQEFRPVGETAFANSVAERASSLGLATKLCAGIVSNIDLTTDVLDAVLDAHAGAAPARLRGVRQIALWNPFQTEFFNSRPEYYNDPRFRRGFTRLVERHLSFDACVFHFQLPQVIDLARSFPETSIILDHIGTPLGIGPYAGRRAEAQKEWAPLMTELARCENVVVKLGGQNMEMAGYDWHQQEAPVTSEILAKSLGEIFYHVIDCFGPERCMFESNFPLDAISSSYVVLWNAFKRIAARFSEGEKSSMFYETANRVYRLGSP